MMNKYIGFLHSVKRIKDETHKQFVNQVEFIAVGVLLVDCVVAHSLALNSLSKIYFSRFFSKIIWK